MKSKKSSALELAKLCCRAMDDKKAEKLAVLDVAEQSSITDYLVIATATSQPHLRALRIEVEKVLDGAGAKIVAMDTSQESGWMVIDAFDVMVHLFLKEVRDRYGLERLWRDATEVNVGKLLKEEKTPKKAAAKKAKPRSSRSSSR